MQVQEIRLQPETVSQHRQVEELIREAFWNHYGPGCNEHYLAHILRGCEAFVCELNMVATQAGVVLGSIMYTKAAIHLDGGGTMPVLTFGPLAVRPDAQGQGVGGALVRHTTALARAMGHKAVIICGDPYYYRRFGFVPAEQFGIANRDNLCGDALQALDLEPGALSHGAGRFFEDTIFNVDAAAAQAFDRGFEPQKEKTGLPSQLRFQELVGQVRPRVEGSDIS